MKQNMKTTLLKVFAILMIVSLGSLAEAHKGGHDGTNLPSDGSARNGGVWPGAAFGPRVKVGSMVILCAKS